MTTIGRRAVLRLGGASVVAALAGCLDDGSDRAASDTDTDVASWEHDTGGGVDEVADGLVLFRKRRTGPDEGGDLVALDAESGDEAWSFELDVPEYNTYSPPAVDGSIYVGFGDDEIGGGNGELYGIDVSGTVEWTRSTGSVYDRPRVVDGRVYAASDDMRLYAFGADGTEHWQTDRLAEAPGSPSIVGIEERIFLNAEGTMVAVDPGDGSVDWEYDGVDGDASVRSGPVVDGVVYLESGAALVALEDGSEQWSVPLDGSRGIPGVSAGNVLVRGDGIRAFDRESGDEQWHADDRSFDGFVPTAVHDRRLYLADDTVYAYDVTDGTREWSAGVGDDMQSVVVSASGNDIFAHQENYLYRIDDDGEVGDDWTFDGTVLEYVVGEDVVYVGTTEKVVAIER